MKVEGKKILEKLERQKTDRRKVTLYLSKTKYDAFRKACDDVAPSQVIEELMVQFTHSVKGKRRG